MAVDKLVDSAQLDADLTSVANAIRTKGGTSADLAFPAGFVSAVQAIPTGGGGIDLNDVFNGTAPSGAVTLSTATKIPDTVFRGNTAITSITAPLCTQIGAMAFYQCSNLETVNFPELISILPSYTNNGVQSGDTGNFAGSFWECNKLGTIHLPKCVSIGGYTFYRVNRYGTTYNAIAVLPSLKHVRGRVFQQSKWKAIDIGADLIDIESDAFYQGTYDAVILRSASVVTAKTRGAVQFITNLWVPQALVASYATASNWSTDASSRTVHAIEGSIYENAYADGTPIT